MLLKMNKWGKIYSNVWLRISDENFEKLVQIREDYQLKSVEEVLELLVNTNTISNLATQSSEFVSQISDSYSKTKVSVNR
jgi:hypothetical protein